jgi:hypothetical protein
VSVFAEILTKFVYSTNRKLEQHASAQKALLGAGVGEIAKISFARLGHKRISFHAHFRRQKASLLLSHPPARARTYTLWQFSICAIADQDSACAETKIERVQKGARHNPDQFVIGRRQLLSMQIRDQSETECALARGRTPFLFFRLRALIVFAGIRTSSAKDAACASGHFQWLLHQYSVHLRALFKWAAGDTLGKTFL